MAREMDATQGGVLEQALHMAGLIKADVTMANLFPTRTKPEGLWYDKSKSFSPEAKNYVGAMHELIGSYDFKVIVPLGAISTKAMLDPTDYTSIRGYPFTQGTRIIIPSLHPRDMVWTNYIWRFYLSHDLHKAKRFATGTGKIDEPRLIITDTLPLAKAIISQLAKQKMFSLDIEVSNYEISCIGFCWDVELAIPFPSTNVGMIQKSWRYGKLWPPSLGIPTSVSFYKMPTLIFISSITNTISSYEG